MALAENIESPPISEDFLHDFAAALARHGNCHGSDQVLDLLHPRILRDGQVFWLAPLRGSDAVRAYVDAIWRAMPDATANERRVTSDLLQRELFTRRIAEGLDRLRSGNSKATERLCTAAPGTATGVPAPADEGAR